MPAKQPDHWAVACGHMKTGVLKTEEFHSAWTDWVRHRREMRNALTGETIKRQIRQCEKWGHDKALQFIEHTIFKGWRGLREAPDEPVKQTQQPGSPVDDAKVAQAWWDGLSVGDQGRWTAWFIKLQRTERPANWQGYVEAWKADGSWVQRIYNSKGRAG